MSADELTSLRARVLVLEGALRERSAQLEICRNDCPMFEHDELQRERHHRSDRKQHPGRDDVSEPTPLPSDWHNYEGLAAIFRAALQGICANPEFFGAIYQGSPRAAVDFAKDIVRAALDQGVGEP